MNSSTARDDLSPDVVLSAVASEQRRAVLRTLNRTDGSMAFSRLVNRVADQVRADGGEQVADEHRRRVRTELHHTHLPKLVTSGLVVYDTEAMQVETATGGLGRELLSVVEPYEDLE